MGSAGPVHSAERRDRRDKIPNSTRFLAATVAAIPSMRQKRRDLLPEAPYQALSRNCLRRRGWQ